MIYIKEQTVSRNDSDRQRRAKLFWNGRSQAVRLPKEFRFEGDEVAIRKEGDSVVLEPIDGRSWPSSFWEKLDDLRSGLDFEEAEPMGGALLDVDEDGDVDEG